jgi:hypothetical protein
VTLEQPDAFAEITSNLSSGEVRFTIPDTSQSDTAPTDPIVYWLTVFPTADEGPAD